MAGFEAIADSWLAHVRNQGDAWFGVNAAAFVERLPPPGRATLEIGCGEGRFGRELVALGHRVTGVELSPTLAAIARESFDVVEADAAALPFDDASFDLVVAFMSLIDIDDMAGAVREAARVLEPGHRFSAAIVHPVLSAGEGEPFTITGSYLEPRRYRANLITTETEIESWHRPLEAYTRAFADAGLLLETMCELQGVRRPAPADLAPPARAEDVTSLREIWDRQAAEWARFARRPGHDRTAEAFNLPRLFDLLPPPGRRTLDLGCGEGRVGRALLELGHRVVAFMSLMDMDSPDRAISETGRVLERGGRFCFCIAHPLATAGGFAERGADAPFVLEGSYFEERRTSLTVERDGIRIDFASLHRPLDAWFRDLETAGLAIEALREHPFPREAWRRHDAARWTRIPPFLHVRAVKT